MSWRARFFLFLLAHRHWLRLKPRREVVDERTSIPAWRARVEKPRRLFGKLPGDLEIEPLTIEAPNDVGGLYAEWLRPAGARPDRAVLYFHGGGYVVGSARSHRPIVAKLAVGSGLPALTFDYRLAPEHPFPAALDDAVSTYVWLRDHGLAPESIAFAGESAGGGLVLATLLALRERGLPLPSAAVVMSPWTDVTCGGASYARRDPLAADGSWQVFGRCYAGGHDPRDPRISPLFADLAGLPPLLVYVGSNEAMLDDSVLFAEKARAAGVDVRLEIGKGMVHGYPVLAPLFPEATAAMADVCRFLRQRTGG